MNDKTHLANEAARLKADDTLNLAFDTVRNEALEALASADAADLTNILRLQQRVVAVDEIRSTLDRYILAAPVERDGATPYA